MKVGLLLVCTGELYWLYAKQLITSAHTHFLPGKDVEYLFWTDIPQTGDVFERVQKAFLEARLPHATTEAEREATQKESIEYAKATVESVEYVRGLQDVTLFSTDHTAWPYPTLMRYSLFLQQEEVLQKYDYLFYCDIDMLMVDTVGDEIIGLGLTAAQHPMYALRQEYQAPYEPNPQSAAFIPPHFYYAGGFQGGKREDFIEAMKAMKKTIDSDLSINYVARWNDESHWNKYLWDKLPSRVLTPAYVYPDSLIGEYYVKLWGCDYPKKIITLTKKFTLSKTGADHIRQFVQTS